MNGAHKTGFALPADPVTDGEIANLAAELERRKAIKAEQDAESARLAAEAEEKARTEQARKDAEEVERLRRLEIVDRAALVPVPSGALLSETGLTGNTGDVISVLDTQLRFGAVVKAEGALRVPVVTCNGLVSVADGVTLKAHRLASQLLRKGTEGAYLTAYRVAVRAAWDRLVAAEVERGGEGPGVMLYTAALPAVTVEQDELMPSLVRIVGRWGDCFAYRLPDL